jgi:septum formation protein
MFRTLQPIVLASSSPRRKDLLLSLGIDFEVYASLIEESGEPVGSPDPGAGPVEIAKGWARLKAASVSPFRPEAWIMGADTIVVLDGKIFGKPSDMSEAARMLDALSGGEHEVITGMCLVQPGGKVRRNGAVVTRVRFKRLSAGEVKAYVRTGEPMDKAGAYGIQDRGAFLVRSIEGSYTNVVGLPLSESIDWLRDEGIIEPV